ncbi:MAG: DUF5312 family protein [Treponema sp.]|jgi:hypothetical protein|nr:DUF5312 family protein [Treponema sp.]
MGLLEIIAKLFSGDNDPRNLAKKRMRQVSKALSQNKYSKFFKVKSEELEPPAAKFFYDLYKVVSPAQIFLQNAAKSEQLKQITLDAFLDNSLRALQDQLDAAAIQEKAASASIKNLAETVKRDLAAFMAAFDSVRIYAVNSCYNTIITLSRFVNFDFFFLLKKFDSKITERNFNYQPRFQPVKAAELKEALQDFMELSAVVEMDRDWKTALGVLKAYKAGIDVMEPDQWFKTVRILKDVGRSRILEQIIQQVMKDPVWQSVSTSPNERLAETFLEAKRAEIESILGKIQNDKRSAQIDQLAQTVFGSADVNRLNNYTPQAGEILVKKNFEGFTKAAGLSYLKAFLLDFFKKEVRELCDLFLVRGQWISTSLSQPMSNAFHEIMELQDKINALDDALGEKGEHGARIKQTLPKVDRDKGQGKYIRIILNTVNGNAQRMINTAMANCVIIGKHFKSLLEDIPKTPPGIIMNWRELENVSEEPLAKRITRDYKRMYYFVQLMQFFASPAEETPP